MTAPRTPRSFSVGLIGQGVGPSLSPELHEREAARQGLRYVYKTVDLTADRTDGDHLRRLLEFAVELGFDGLNVTHPVKQVMVPLVDRLSPQVEAIGALNTVLIRDGVTTGHNTDVSGFSEALRSGLPEASLDSVVLLGAGGAGTAVAHALSGLGVEELYVVDHDVSRAEQVVASLARAGSGSTVHALEAAGLPERMKEASGLVNATPVGMAAHPGIPVDAAVLHDGHWVVDIVYRPLMTELVRTATARGCRVLSGAGMAVHQAADAFELFTGLAADRPAMSADFDALVASELNPSLAPLANDGGPDERNRR